MWDEVGGFLAPQHKFEIPSHIEWGLGVSRSLGVLVKAIGGKAVLLLTDRSVGQLPATRMIIDALKEQELVVEVFEGVVGEPTNAMVEAAVQFVRAHSKDAVVIGMGGGSILDQSKIAAAMVGNEGSFEVYCGANKLHARGLPLVLVPTTAGTGSETSKNAIFVDSNGTKKVISSPMLLAELVVVDPLLTVSLPANVTAFTGMDALSHAIEGILSLRCNPVVEGIALQAIRLVHENLVPAFCNGNDLVARENMCVAAMLGGMCLNAGVVLGHSIAYTLGHFDLPHGLGCATALPHIMRFNMPCTLEKMGKIALALGAEQSTGEALDLPRYALQAVVDLANDLGMPVALSAIGVSKDDLPTLAEECYQKYPRPSNPRQYSKDELFHLYERLWSGELGL